MSVSEQALGATPPLASSEKEIPSQEGVVSPDVSARDMFGVGAVWTKPDSDMRVYIETPSEVVISGGGQKRVVQLFGGQEDVRIFLENKDNGYTFDHFRGQAVATPDVVGSTEDKPALVDAGEIPVENKKKPRGTARKAKRASGGAEQGDEGAPLKPKIGTVEQSTEEIGTVAQNNGNLEELLAARKIARSTVSDTSVESARVLPRNVRQPGKTRREKPREIPPVTVKDTSWKKELDIFLERPEARERVQKIEGILLERWNAFSEGIIHVSNNRKHFLWNRFVIAKLEEVLVQYLMSTSQIDEQEAQKIFRAIDRDLQEKERAKK